MSATADFDIVDGPHKGTTTRLEYRDYEVPTLEYINMPIHQGKKDKVEDFFTVAKYRREVLYKNGNPYKSYYRFVG